MLQWARKIVGRDVADFAAQVVGPSTQASPQIQQYVDNKQFTLNHVGHLSWTEYGTKEMAPPLGGLFNIFYYYYNYYYHY